MKRQGFFFGLILLLTAGCVSIGPYGTLWSAGARPTIQELEENWTDYNVYYGGLGVNNPSAVLFVPKKMEGRVILESNWKPVTSDRELSIVVRWLQANIEYPPHLWKVLGPGGQLFGYMYTYYNSVYLKETSEGKLMIGGLPLPPFNYGPGKF